MASSTSGGRSNGSARARRQHAIDSDDRFNMLYMAIVNVVSKSAPIQEARAALQPSILALLPAKEAAERFTFLTVSLVTLKSVHLDLGPEVSLAKLRAISDEMRQVFEETAESMRQRVGAALRDEQEQNEEREH